jgi:hypothetical protein
MSQSPYGPPGPPMDYTHPPHGPHGAAPPPASQRGFVSGLFDLSFTTFVTTRVLKVLYALFLVVVLFSTLGGIGAGLMMFVGGMSSDGAAASVMGLLQVLMTPFVALFALIYGRVAFEMVAVFFRVAEHLAEINRKTAG